MGLGADGFGVGLGPAVLAAVAGLAVDGREVHMLGHRGRDDAVHSPVRAVRQLDRLKPLGEHAYAHRMSVQVGHPRTADRAQPGRVHRPLGDHVRERVVRERDLVRDYHHVGHGLALPGGFEQRLDLRPFDRARPDQPHDVVRLLVPGGRHRAVVDQSEHGVHRPPFDDHQHRPAVAVGSGGARLVRAAVHRRSVHQYGRAHQVMHSAQEPVGRRSQRDHGHRERLLGQVDGGHAAHVDHCRHVAAIRHRPAVVDGQQTADHHRGDRQQRDGSAHG